MRHWRARRMLPDLLDGDLPADREAALQAHVERCGRCARRLRRFELADRLLARMPRAFFSLDAPAIAEARLGRLALWEPRPVPRGHSYGGTAAVCSLAAAAAVMVFALGTLGWTPLVGDLGTSTVVASVMPDSSYVPLGWR